MAGIGNQSQRVSANSRDHFDSHEHECGPSGPAQNTRRTSPAAVCVRMHYFHSVTPREILRFSYVKQVKWRQPFSIMRIMTISSRGRQSVILRLAALALCQAALAFAQAPSSASGYVGSNVCRTCHADIWLNFYKNPHYKSIASGKEAPERTGCEGCHGPGQAHVQAGGGRNTIPRAFSLLTPKQALETCLTCHSSDFGKVNIRRSDHTLNDVACNSCHSIHRSPVPKYLLAKRQSELCYTCHATVRAQFDMPSKHRVNEGFVQCSDCHNPHGAFAPVWRMSQRPRMVDQAAGNEEPCLKCHSDKRGPFVYEHPPVRIEGCETCHFPHGSTNTRLLRRPVVFTLCLQCHNGAGDFGTHNVGIPVASSSHNLLDPRYQRCTTCHVRIHGSNSDGFFLR
ncbi:MAG: cytochrome C [Terriglobia bacterium]|nr:MAG: cytochrome C [Terriglobia bacterium]